MSALSDERRTQFAATRTAMARQLRELSRGEQNQPIPERIVRLLRELELREARIGRHGSEGEPQTPH